MKRLVASTALTLMGSVLVISNAQAVEGHWASYWEAVLPGIDSRKWTDGNLTADSTNIAMKNCKFDAAYNTNFKSLHLTLKYDNTWTPDETMGQSGYSCGVPTWVTGHYGRLKKGGYFFHLDSVNNTDHAEDYLDVGGIDVVY